MLYSVYESMPNQLVPWSFVDRFSDAAVRSHSQLVTGSVSKQDINVWEHSFRSIIEGVSRRIGDPTCKALPFTTPEMYFLVDSRWARKVLSEKIYKTLDCRARRATSQKNRWDNGEGH